MLAEKVLVLPLSKFQLSLFKSCETSAKSFNELQRTRLRAVDINGNTDLSIEHGAPLTSSERRMCAICSGKLEFEIWDGPCYRWLARLKRKFTNR